MGDFCAIVKATTMRSEKHVTSRALKVLVQQCSAAAPHLALKGEYEALEASGVQQDLHNTRAWVLQSGADMLPKGVLVKARGTEKGAGVLPALPHRLLPALLPP